MQGWLNYCSISEGLSSELSKIDSWLRFRIRMIIWKQWKTIQKREWGQLKLGCSRHWAHSTACARQSYTRCASAFLNRFISKKLLDKKGLVSCYSCFKRAHVSALERTA
ncbi:MAG: hypothetical protein HUJ54_04425 [Erysipelotrichaceae bacterium]|nr:hypothetical protein [Erysipelotrichaceae bacterium]